MKLDKLTIAELHEILSSQMKILADYREQLPPEQKQAIKIMVDNIVSEINNRREKSTS